MLNIKSVKDLKVGDVGFYVIAGRVGGLVSFGQWLIDAANLARGRETEQAWFTHAFIVIDVSEAGVCILEAMPSGARPVWIEGTERCGPGYGWARLPLNVLHTTYIQDAGPGLIGTPYSFLDYLSLALLHLGAPRSWTAGRVKDSGHMICSQLVDYLLCQAGFKLFDDGRLPQDVTPGALFRKCGGVGEVMWW